MFLFALHQSKLFFIFQRKYWILVGLFFAFLLLGSEIILSFYGLSLRHRLEQQQYLLQNYQFNSRLINFFDSQFTVTSIKKTVLQRLQGDLFFLNFLKQLHQLPSQIYLRQIVYQSTGVEVKGLSVERAALQWWSGMFHKKIALTIKEIKDLESKINFNIVIKIMYGQKTI